MKGDIFSWANFGTAMIFKSVTIVGVVAISTVAAHAGSAPKELYGKSITVQWSESVTGRTAADQITQNWLTSGLMSIYISSAGRPFVRRSVRNMLAGRTGRGAGSRSFDTAPDQSSSGAKDRVDVQGHLIVVYSEFHSGARRIAIDLGGAPTGCNATVVNGRQAGKNIVHQTGGHGLVEVTSVHIESVTCSIREGNVFGQ
jgi:hypothetical protein